MNTQEKWLAWAIELQSIAQAGIFYSKDKFDIERFERIRTMAAEMISYKTDIPVNKVKDLFCNETGYQTPKIDTRAAIFSDGKILLVQETDGRWSLPGGWCEVNVSVKENTIKDVCKIFVLCSVVGGHFEKNIETTALSYFSEEELPALATEKNNEAQIKMCFDAYKSPNWEVLFD